MAPGENPLNLQYDQRDGKSYPRTIGLKTDIGAYEASLFTE